MFEINEQMKFMGFGHLSPMRPMSQFDTGPNNIKNVLYDMNTKLNPTLKYMEERNFAPLKPTASLPLEVKKNYDYLNTYVHEPLKIHDVWPEKKKKDDFMFFEKPAPPLPDFLLPKKKSLTEEHDERYVSPSWMIQQKHYNPFTHQFEY